MLHLLVADSELETVPAEISDDRIIKKKARDRGKEPEELMLDSNYFHKAMENIEDHERRGRPDIIHVCLLTALDSPLNREGHLKIHIHTRNDEVIEVNPETRIPRSYNRFIGLMEQLFEEKKIPPGDNLLEMYDSSLSEKLEEIDAESNITLSGKGRSFEGREIFQDYCLEEDIAVIVGGFPHEDFLSDVESFSDEIISIYPESLDAVTVVTHMIQFYEEEFNVI